MENQECCFLIAAHGPAVPSLYDRASGFTTGSTILGQYIKPFLPFWWASVLPHLHFQILLHIFAWELEVFSPSLSSVKGSNSGIYCTPISRSQLAKGKVMLFFLVRRKVLKSQGKRPIDHSCLCYLNTLSSNLSTSLCR